MRRIFKGREKGRGRRANAKAAILDFINRGGQGRVESATKGA